MGIAFAVSPNPSPQTLPPKPSPHGARPDRLNVARLAHQSWRTIVAGNDRSQSFSIARSKAILHHHKLLFSQRSDESIVDVKDAKWTNATLLTGDAS